MKIKLPFCNGDNKTDVQISLSYNLDRRLSEEEKRAFNILADIFTCCKLKYIGNHGKTYISIEKNDDGIVIDIPDVDKIEKYEEE